tara:strand:+ start:1773 stop:2924 length:1152 start_codon:yes stop_codon:yes gene_type:complete
MRKNNKLKNRFCHKPWEQAEIGAVGIGSDSGRVSMCCQCWVEKPIGSVTEDNLLDAWNSEYAQKVRQGVLDGTFSECNEKFCPHIQNGLLPERDEVLNNDTFLWDGIYEMESKHYRDIILNNEVTHHGPEYLHLSYDESCNLSCPSCRCEKIQFTEGSEYEKRRAVQDKIMKYAFDTNNKHRIIISITGSGDPFGSKMFREFLFAADASRNPNVFYNIQTNGVLLNRTVWDKMSKIHSRINTLLISVDAGTKEVYDQVRRGGNWSKLNENLLMLKELKETEQIKGFRTDMIIQQRNYKDMAKFIQLAKSVNSDSAYLAVIRPWSQSEAYKEGFHIHDVWRRDHPEHQQFLDILRDPIFDDPIVDLGNVSEYRERAYGQISEFA